MEPAPALPQELNKFFSDAAKRGLNLETAMNTYTFDQVEADNLYDMTTDQSENNLWFQHRKNRVTSSSIYPILQVSAKPTRRKVIEMASKIQMEDSDSTSSYSKRAMEYGRRMEPLARHAYEGYMSQFHRNIVVEIPGLKLSRHFPFMGATLDGLVSCSCHNL